LFLALPLPHKFTIIQVYFLILKQTNVMEKTTSLATIAKITPLSLQVQADLKGGIFRCCEEKRRPLTVVYYRLPSGNIMINGTVFSPNAGY
jgi:hypothetical protein